MGCAAMCFLYELLKFFLPEYCGRIEFMLCIVVQHPSAKKTMRIFGKKLTTHLIFKCDAIGASLPSVSVVEGGWG